MNFEATSNTIKGLFGGTRVYQIPRFQRDFSWDKKNYEEFFEDMLSQILFNDNFSTSEYYLGNMLFLGEKNKELVEVIDGQQRLTTITILLAALRNTLFSISKKEEDISSAYAETIQTEYLIKKIDGKPQRKLETSTSYPYFTQTIQDYETANNHVKPETEEEELLEEAFSYFMKSLEKENLFKKIENLNKHVTFNFNDDFYLNSLKSLRDQILRSTIIEIFVSNKEEANKIFENINSKGKPLSQVDLIKNSIFENINVTQGGVDEISRDWQEFNKKISTINTSFNEFFLHFWKTVYPEDNANGNNLYDKYNKKFNKNNNSDNLKKLIEDIKKSLDLYIEIVNPDSNKYLRQEKKYEEEYLKALSNLKGVQVRIALLALYRSPIKIKNVEKFSFLKFLSDFHLAVFLTGLRGNKSTTLYKNFAIDIKKSKENSDVNEAIKKLKQGLVKVIKKDTFIKSFCNLTFAKKETKSGHNFPAQYAIKQISNFLENRYSNEPDYTIEHILDEEFTEKNKNIGNLIVLENKYNQELNILKQKSLDIDYEKKLEIYKKSRYKIMEEFIKSYNNFSNKDIDSRADKLANFFWDTFFNI